MLQLASAHADESLLQVDDGLTPRRSSSDVAVAVPASSASAGGESPHARRLSVTLADLELRIGDFIDAADSIAAAAVDSAAENHATAAAIAANKNGGASPVAASGIENQNDVGASTAASAAKFKKPPPLSPGLRVLFICALVHATTMGMQLVARPALMLDIYDDDSSAAAKTNAILTVTTGVIGFFTTLSLSALSDAYGRRPFLLAALAANAASLLVVGFSYNLTGLVLSSVLGALFDVSNSVTYAVLADLLPPEEYSRVMNLFAAALGVGILAGPGLGMLCSFIEPQRLPFIVSGVLTALNLLWLHFKLPETLHWAERVKLSEQALEEEERQQDGTGRDERKQGVAEHYVAINAGPAMDPAAAANNGAAAAASVSASPPLGSPLLLDPLLVRPVPFEIPAEHRSFRGLLRAGRVHPFRNVQLLASTRPLLRLSSSLVLHSLADGMMGAIIFLFTKEVWGWEMGMNNAMLVAGGIASIVVMGFVAPRLQRHPRVGEHRLLRFGQFLGIFQHAMLIVLQIGWPVFPLSIISGFVFVWTPTLRAQISRQLDVSRQGELQGAIACVTAVASIVSSTMANALFSFFANKDGPVHWPGLTFLVGVAFNALAVLVVLGVDTRGLAKDASLAKDETAAAEVSTVHRAATKVNVDEAATQVMEATIDHALGHASLPMPISPRSSSRALLSPRATIGASLSPVNETEMSAGLKYSPGQRDVSRYHKLESD
jgi:MFS family permease